MLRICKVFGLVLGITCLLYPSATSMSIMMEPQIALQEETQGQHFEKLSELKKALIEKMKIISNVLEYIDTYAKTKVKLGGESLSGLEKIEIPNELRDPLILSKYDVYLEDQENVAEVPFDLIGSILDATLHDRFKRSPSPRKGKRSGEEEDAEAERDGEEDEDKKKRKGRKSRKSQKKKSRS